MPTTTIRVDSDLLQRVESVKPSYLSTTGFFQLLAEQALDKGFTLKRPSPASGGPAMRGEGLNNKEEEDHARALSENKPPAQQKQVDPALAAHTAAIRAFWRVKKGSKGERAWSLLMTGLRAIQSAYGDKVVAQQLDLAENGRWQGITLENYERFKPANTQKIRKRVSEEELERLHAERTKNWGLH